MGRRKKKKNRAWIRLRQGLESISLRLLLAAVARVPPQAHGALARAMAKLLIALPLRRGVVEQNLVTAFPEKTEPERRRQLRGVYAQSMSFVLELPRLRQATSDEVCAAVSIEPDDLRHMEELIATGQGFLMASAHLGNWEWLGAWAARIHGRVGVVYKPMHNPRTDAIAQELRQRFGIKIFSTRDRLPRELFAHIRGGGAVAILADQDARRQGRFIPFFGKPASTSVGLASLALRLRVPILPGFCLRDDTGQFRIRILPPLQPDPQADREAEEDRLMTAYNRCVEEMIRQAPDQYFWWHRRWKTRPRPAATEQKEEPAQAGS